MFALNHTRSKIYTRLLRSELETKSYTLKTIHGNYVHASTQYLNVKIWHARFYLHSQRITISITCTYSTGLADMPLLRLASDSGALLSLLSQSLSAFKPPRRFCSTTTTTNTSKQIRKHSIPYDRPQIISNMKKMSFDKARGIANRFTGIQSLNVNTC